MAANRWRGKGQRAYQPHDFFPRLARRPSDCREHTDETMLAAICAAMGYSVKDVQRQIAERSP